MKTQIEKWLEKRQETVSKEWKQEYQYMMVLVLFWGFGTLISTLRGLADQRKADAEDAIKMSLGAIDIVVDDLEEGSGE